MPAGGFKIVALSVGLAQVLLMSKYICLGDSRVGIISLVKPFEADICIQALHVLLVHILHKRVWLVLDNADVVHSAAADLDDLSMH